MESESIHLGNTAKNKGENDITDYKLVSSTDMNGYTVNNFAPIMSEDEYKKRVNELVAGLLREYNALCEDENR